MAAPKITLDHAGMEHVLRVMAKAAVEEAAEQVAAQARPLAHGAPVETTTYETDRVHVVVAITDPAGVALQAKYGVLTRAAGATGLEVTEQ